MRAYNPVRRSIGGYMAVPLETSVFAKWLPFFKMWKIGSQKRQTLHYPSTVREASPWAEVATFLIP